MSNDPWSAEQAGPRTNTPSKSIVQATGDEVTVDCYGCTVVRHGSTYAGGGKVDPNGNPVVSP